MSQRRKSGIEPQALVILVILGLVLAVLTLFVG
jgi:hypothetical protein